MMVAKQLLHQLTHSRLGKQEIVTKNKKRLGMAYIFK
jgi:hypothetical protein